MITKEFKYTDVVLQRMPNYGIAGLYRNCKFTVEYMSGNFDITVTLPQEMFINPINVFPEFIPGTEQPVGTFDEAIDAAMFEIDEHLKLIAA